MRRFVFAILKSLGTLFAALLLLTLVGFGWLQTDGGQHFVARQTERFFDKTFEGKLRVEKLRIGFRTIEIVDAQVSDPENIPVLGAKQAHVHVRWLALFSKRIEVRTLVVQRPFLRLEKTQAAPERWSFLRALHKRHPAKQKKEKRKPIRWSLLIGSFSFTEGTFVRQQPDTEPQQTPFRTQGALFLSSEKLNLDDFSFALGKLSLGGQVRLPFRGGLPATVTLQGVAPADSLAPLGWEDPRTWHVDLSINGPFAATNAHLRAFTDTLPGWEPANVALTLQGSFTQRAVVVQTFKLNANDFVLESGGTAQRESGAWLPDFWARFVGHLPSFAPTLASEPKRTTQRLFLQGTSAIKGHQFLTHIYGRLSPQRFLDMRLAGTTASDWRGAQLDIAEFVYPGSRWKNAGPASLGLRQEYFLKNLRMHSGRQLAHVDAIWKNKVLLAQIDLQNIDLGRMPFDVLGSPLQPKGMLNAHINTNGPIKQPRGKISVTLSQGSLAIHGKKRDIMLQQIRGKLQAQLDDAQWQGKFDFGIADTTLRGSISSPGPKNANEKRDILGELHIRQLDLEDLLALRATEKKPPPPLSGKAFLDAKITGTLPFDLTATGSVAIQNAKMQHFEKVTARSTFSFSPHTAHVEARLGNGRAAIAAVNATLHSPAEMETRLGIPKSLDEAEECTVDFNATVNNISPLEISKFGFPGGLPLAKSLVDVRIHAQGPLAAPQAKLFLVGKQLPPNDKGMLNLSVLSNAQTVRINAQAQTGPVNTLLLQLNIPMHLGLSHLRNHTVFNHNAPVEGSFQSHALDVGLISGFFPRLFLTGQLNGAARLSGTLANPRGSGRIVWDKGSVGIAGFRTYRDLKLVSHFDSEHVFLDELTTRSEGSLHLTGEIHGVGGPQQTFAGTLKANNFIIFPVRLPDYNLSADIALQGRRTHEQLEATITVGHPNGFILYLKELLSVKLGSPLTPNPEITVVGRPRTQTQEEGQSHGLVQVNLKNVPPKTSPLTVATPGTPTQAPGKNIRLNLVTKGNLRFEGPDLELGFTAENFFLTRDQHGLLLHGTVKLVKPGRLEVVGRRFQVQRCTLEFPDSAPRAGELDLEASVDVRPTGKAIVAIQGPIAKPTLDVDASAEAGTRSREEIIAALLTGQWPEQGLSGIVSGGIGATGPSGNPDQSSTAAARVGAAGIGAVANLLLQRVQNFIAGRTHLLINFDVQQQPDTSQRTAVVQVGRYLSPRLFVAYENRIGAEPETNRNQVNVNYRLSRRWMLEASYGDANEGGISVMWRKRF